MLNIWVQWDDVIVYEFTNLNLYDGVKKRKKATGQTNSLPSRASSEAVCMVTGPKELSLCCNRNPGHNKSRACCWACDSSIMQKRCTDRTLLVKYNTCKSRVTQPGESLPCGHYRLGVILTLLLLCSRLHLNSKHDLSSEEQIMFTLTIYGFPDIYYNKKKKHF